MDNLIPITKNRREFDGFIQAGGQSYRLHVKKTGNTLESTRFSCDWRLRNLLKKHLKLLELRLQQCEQIEDFVNELQTLAQNSSIYREKSSTKPHCYEAIIQHIEELGWKNLHAISKDFTEAQLKVIDSNERTHLLTLTFDTDYPKTSPKVSASLPFPFVPLWASGSTLVTLYGQFKTNLAQYERFWADVEELQYNTWILEPESPNNAATTFRIALGTSCSMQIKIDPFQPQVLPECQFLGADWAVSPFRDKFHEKIEDWNETLSVYQNFKDLLEIDFPQKPHDGSQNVSLQCGICYAYRLETDIPDQICNDRRCGQAFHHQCLLEWIQSIPGTKQSFNVLFGECPYCTKPIRLPILHK